MIDEVVMGQKYRHWLAVLWPKGSRVILTVAKPMSYEGATPSIIVPSIG
ncbi:hypothetical protein [Pseudovibrio denitrificans]|nr:hypothetical protein [Pseudovibrio denitrificans]